MHTTQALSCKPLIYRRRPPWPSFSFIYPPYIRCISLLSPPNTKLLGAALPGLQHSIMRLHLAVRHLGLMHRPCTSHAHRNTNKNASCIYALPSVRGHKCSAPHRICRLLRWELQSPVQAARITASPKNGHLSLRRSLSAHGSGSVRRKCMAAPFLIGARPSALAVPLTHAAHCQQCHWYPGLVKDRGPAAA